MGNSHLKTIQCDLSDWKGTRAILESAIPQSVAVWYLANVAGAFVMEPFDKISEENFTLQSIYLIRLHILAFLILFYNINFIEILVNLSTTLTL